MNTIGVLVLLVTILEVWFINVFHFFFLMVDFNGF